MNQERADELIQEIGTAILEDQAVAGAEWDALALVARLHEGFSLHGFLYFGDAAEPFSPDGDELFELLPELQDAMTDGEDHVWKACLYTIVAPDMELDVDFEYDNANRWAVTPDNIDTIAETIRPH